MCFIKYYVKYIKGNNHPLHQNQNFENFRWAKECKKSYIIEKL